MVELVPKNEKHRLLVLLLKYFTERKNAQFNAWSCGESIAEDVAIEVGVLQAVASALMDANEVAVRPATIGDILGKLELRFFQLREMFAGEKGTVFTGSEISTRISHFLP